MKYNYNGFSQNSNEIINIAIGFAEGLGHTYIGSEHILYAVCGKENTKAYNILNSNGITKEIIEEKIKSEIGVGTPTFLNYEHFSSNAKAILDSSLSIYYLSFDKKVEPCHILFSIIKNPDCYAYRLLTDSGIDVNSLKTAMSENMGLKTDCAFDTDYASENDLKTKGKLLKYAKDLTLEAANGRLDPVFERDFEIERLIQILLRRTKNNPLLIGEPGVGKTAVVEGLAQKIASGDVPYELMGKRLLALSLTGIVAGTKYRGDFEERISEIIKEVISNKNILLFIDEIHTLVGAGSAEGSTDASNILKPYLARGEIRLIGATTVSEYKKTIEKDSALDRRFLSVTINEPSVSETEKILFGLRTVYEEHHKIKITDEAIRSAVKLSERYIVDKYFPDKAIDLIDEACSSVKISKKKLCIDELLKVTENDILSIVRTKLGLTADLNNAFETVKYFTLEDCLKKRIIGQDNAVSLVSNALRRSRAGLKDRTKPIGSFLFLGPTGVGKTMLCKELSSVLFGNDSKLIRFDMSEYSEKHSVSRLVGSPAGYVGYEEGGLLTDKVRRNPYSVVLFDEMEKAHPDILNLLLQILDEGTLTDSFGRKADFRNTVIILTSNIGAKALTENKYSLGFARENGNELNEKVLNELKSVYNPELLNRFDEIIIFNKLSFENIKEITSLFFNALKEKLLKININIDFSNELLDFISKKSFDKSYGARPVKRAVQTEIENILSDKILSGEIKENDFVFCDYINGKLNISKKIKASAVG